MLKDSELSAKSIASLIAIYRGDPERYFRERLGTNIFWDGEIAMLEAVPEAIEQHKNIVVPSGHSLGKDFICGGLVPYFLEVWGPCIVINTAPTDRQVKEVMWGEVKTHYANAPVKPPGDMFTQKIEIAPKWYAIGFTTKETGAMVGKFQSFHANRVFVIVSEAQAVADIIYEQIDSILTGQVGLMIQIGNPLRSSGKFAKDIDDHKHNIVIRLDCEENPNYLEDRTVVPGLCSRAWVKKKEALWGREDPRFLARVKGIKPKTSIDTVFSQDIIDKMLNLETRQTMVRRGCAGDIARFGDDETVLYGGTNGMIEAHDIYTGQSTTATAANLVKLNKRISDGNFMVVDGDGVGGGTIDTLNDMELAGIDIIEIHGQGKPLDKAYFNLRAEIWFTALKRAKLGKASIPNDPILIEELLEVRFFVNKKGKIQIELKVDIKDPERLGRSPNRADAWVMLQYGFDQADPIEKKKDAWDDQQDTGSGVIASAAGKGGMVG